MQATTDGRSAPRRFTTIRAVAHIWSPGETESRLQQRAVISGTSAAASISGNSTTSSGSAASSARPRAARKRAKPARASASVSPRGRRAAMASAKPLSRSQSSPATVGSQVRGPRTASCPARVWWSTETRTLSRAPNRSRSASRPARRFHIGFIALVRTSASNPRSSASPSMARKSGFMNGSPPVNPIVRVPNRPRSISSKQAAASSARM